jgi:hypothetical protein
MRLFEMGQRVPRQRILRDAARPYMEDLYQATHETILCGSNIRLCSWAAVFRARSDHAAIWYSLVSP